METNFVITALYALYIVIIMQRGVIISYRINMYNIDNIKPPFTRENTFIAKQLQSLLLLSWYQPPNYLGDFIL